MFWTLNEGTPQKLWSKILQPCKSQPVALELAGQRKQQLTLRGPEIVSYPKLKIASPMIVVAN